MTDYDYLDNAEGDKQWADERFEAARYGVMVGQVTGREFNARQRFLKRVHQAAVAEIASIHEMWDREHKAEMRAELDIPQWMVW